MRKGYPEREWKNGRRGTKTCGVTHTPCNIKGGEGCEAPKGRKMSKFERAEDCAFASCTQKALRATLSEKSAGIQVIFVVRRPDLSKNSGLKSLVIFLPQFTIVGLRRTVLRSPTNLRSRALDLFSRNERTRIFSFSLFYYKLYSFCDAM